MGAGQEMEGAKENLPHPCLKAAARGPDAQGPPRPARAQTRGALDFGGPGLVEKGGGQRPQGHRAQSRHSIDCI